MKEKVITLAIVPVVALTGCDDDPDRHRTKINSPERVYIQNNQPAHTQRIGGAYYKCPNGKVVAEGQSCAVRGSTSGGGSGSYGGGSQDGKSSVKRGGFGSGSGKSGG